MYKGGQKKNTICGACCFLAHFANDVFFMKQMNDQKDASKMFLLEM